jgi:hypothetical protein
MPETQAIAGLVNLLSQTMRDGRSRFDLAAEDMRHAEALKDMATGLMGIVEPSKVDACFAGAQALEDLARQRTGFKHRMTDPRALERRLMEIGKVNPIVCAFLNIYQHQITLPLDAVLMDCIAELAKQVKSVEGLLVQAISKNGVPYVVPKPAAVEEPAKEPTGPDPDLAGPLADIAGMSASDPCAVCGDAEESEYKCDLCGIHLCLDHAGGHKEKCPKLKTT